MTVTETISAVLPSSHTGGLEKDLVTTKATEGSKPEMTISATASAIVRLRPQWVWHRLSDPCNWPAFLEHLSLVTRSDFDLDDYTWSVLNFTCPIRLTVREPPLHLAWQSGIGAEPQLSGEIILESVEWQTRLTVRLNYVTNDPPLILLLQTLEAQLRRDVTRMAQMLERESCEPS